VDAACVVSHDVGMTNSTESTAAVRCIRSSRKVSWPVRLFAAATIAAGGAVALGALAEVAGASTVPAFPTVASTTIGGLHLPTLPTALPSTVTPTLLPAVQTSTTTSIGGFVTQQNLAAENEYLSSQSQTEVTALAATPNNQAVQTQTLNQAIATSEFQIAQANAAAEAAAAHRSVGIVDRF
jgi:hypothetical protein